MSIRRRGELGKVFEDGEVVVQQGDVGEEMYVIQAGKVEVVLESGDNRERVAVLGPKDFFGAWFFCQDALTQEPLERVDQPFLRRAGK